MAYDAFGYQNYMDGLFGRRTGGVSRSYPGGRAFGIGARAYPRGDDGSISSDDYYDGLVTGRPIVTPSSPYEETGTIASTPTVPIDPVDIPPGGVQTEPPGTWSNTGNPPGTGGLQPKWTGGGGGGPVRRPRQKQPAWMRGQVDDGDPIRAMVRQQGHRPDDEVPGLDGVSYAEMLRRSLTNSFLPNQTGSPWSLDTSLRWSGPGGYKVRDQATGPMSERPGMSQRYFSGGR